MRRLPPSPVGIAVAKLVGSKPRRTANASLRDVTLIGVARPADPSAVHRAAAAGVGSLSHYSSVDHLALGLTGPVHLDNPGRSARMSPCNCMEATVTDRLTRALAAIDAANDQGPDKADLVYGQRMSDELAALYPDASDALRIACRGQHIERWRLPRSDYPEGREGYLTWRREQAHRHAARVAEIMGEVGYDPDAIEAAGRMLRKEGIKRDPAVQALEDVACFTFLRWYAGEFLPTQNAAAIERIVNRTARKMSSMARRRALAEFSLPEAIAQHFRDAEQQGGVAGS